MAPRQDKLDEDDTVRRPTSAELLALGPMRLDQLSCDFAERPTPPQILTSAGWRPLHDRRRK